MQKIFSKISSRITNVPKPKTNAMGEIVWSSSRRRWISLILAWVGVFTAQGQFSLFSSILGPFLKKMDPDVSEQWTAWTTVSFSFAQMISSPLFGWWSNRLRQCRLPSVVSLSLIIIGHIGYCCSEYFSVDARKWVVFWFRFLVGMGSGTPGLLRGYCATASVSSERTAAVTGATAALGLAVIVGPGLTAIFSPLGSTGVALGGFYLHAYNGPAVFSIIICLIQIVLLCTVFIEEYPGLHVEPTNAVSGKMEEEDTLPPYDTFALWGQVWQWFAMWITLINFIICGPGYTMVMFGWTQSESIVYNGGIMAAFGVVSLIVYIIYSFYGSRLQERDVIILGMILMTAFSLLTFPYPGYPVTPASNNQTETSNFTFFNATSPGFRRENGTLLTSIVHGCDTKKYSWCYVVPHVPFILYACTFILLAASFPAVNCAISTILPKIIGPRRQGTWQGVLIGSGGLSRCLGPLASSFAFIAAGPQAAWGFAIAVGISGIVVGLLMRRRYVPLLIKPPADGLDPNRGVMFYPK